MAIFHLQCSHGSRQGGQSALAKVQYVLRQGQYARGRDDLEESDWGHLPEWCAGDPVRLFAAADLHERANGRLYVELEGALPVELDLEHCIALTRAMADVVAATGLPFAWGIHVGRPTEPGKPRNCHFHFVFLERINDGIPRTPEGWFRRANTQDPAAGGAAKDRLLKGHQWLRNVRRRYEQLVNAALERAGRPERVTAASHRDRIARAVAAGDHETADYLRRHPPGQHVGPTACAIERGRPGRPGRPTERGDLARARDAEAARLRAESEGVDHELQELVRAAVAAARDAGVDEESVAAAQSSDPDTVIALDDATESRRRDIRDFVAAVGFDDDMIDDVRGMAAPDNPELGWADVVEWTEAHVAAQVNGARRLGLPVDAIFADARRRGAKPVPHLVRVTQIWAEARRAGFDNGSLGIIYNGAEQRQAGTGWSAIEDVTADIVKEKAEAEAEARAVGLDVEAFYRAAGTRIHPVHALQCATLAKQERIVAAARAALLDADAIERIRVEAESEEHGSGWAALATATEERTKRKVEAEARARGGLPIRLMYEDAALHGTDPVEHLERVSGIWDQALGAGLDLFELIELHHRAEERQDGTGWTAIEDATLAEEERIVAAARAVWLDDDAMERIRREAESKTRGSGWAAVSKATEERTRWVVAARDSLVDVDAVYRGARAGNEDELDALKRETAEAKPIVAAARAAGLDDEAIGRTRGEAESQKPGSGWAAVSKATRSRVRRKEAAEVAARDSLVDVDAVYRGARAGNEDELDALKRETAEAKPIVAAARAAGLDDEAIGRTRGEAESQKPGSGWAAVSKATRSRVRRKEAAEVAARDSLVDVDAVYRGARAGNEDELDALKRETAEAKPIVAAARAAGLDDEAIGRTRGEAESQKPGSGWAAVSKATRSRVRRKEAAEVAARDSLVDVDAVYRGARAGNEDELDALKRETAEAKPIVAAARAAGLDDEAIGRTRGEAESQKPGSGWAAVSKATRSRVRRKEAAEVAARDSLVDVDAVYRGARAGNEDELDALKRETAEAKPIVAAARAAGLDDEAIGRTRGEAESQKPGSGWAAVSKATRSRVRRKEAAEVAARDSLVDVDAVYRGARAGNEDELDALKRETAEAKPIVAAARAAGLDDEAIGRTRGEAESQKPGSGWAAVSKATRSRVRRKEAAEVAARDSLVDVDAVCRGARAGNEDELDALKRETAEAKPIVAAARAAGLDDEAIGRTRGEAESQKPGSGWAAVSKATRSRVRRKEAAEVAARDSLVDVDAVCRGARAGNEDELDALKRETAEAKPIVAAARAAGLDDEAIGRIRGEAESQKPGSGWAAVSEATQELTEEQRKFAAAESAMKELAPQSIGGQRPPRDGPEPELTEEERREIDRRAVEMGLVLPPPEPAEEQRPEPEPTEEQRELAAAERAVEELAPQPIEGQRPPRDGPEPELTEEERREIDRRAVEMGLVSPPPEPAEEQRPEPEPTEEQPELAAAERAVEELAPQPIEGQRPPRDGPEPELTEEERREIDRRAVEMGLVSPPPEPAEEQRPEPEPTEEQPELAAAELEPGIDVAAAYAEAREPNQDEVDSLEQGTTEHRKREEEQQRQRRELADLTADVQATTSGAERLDKMRRARLDATKRSLTLDEEMFVVKEVKLQIEADLARRAAAVEASPRGGELLRRVERRRGGPLQSLGEREETIEAVELRVQAADAAVAWLTALAPDPERPDRRVPPVPDAVLDAVPAGGDHPFLGDVVWLVQARFAQAEQKGVDAGGYDAEEREKSARRHFGSALATAFEWCVLTVRALIWAACHKILGGRGDTGARVQASLEAADVERQSYQRTAYEAARTVAIDLNASSEEARADGRDEVAAIAEETARRRQVFSVAVANDITVRTVFDAHEAQAAGSGIPAIEAAIQRRQEAVAAARRLGVDVDAVCTAARSKCEDPVEALQEETARRTKVLLFSDFIGLSDDEFEDIFRAAEEQRRDSGYTAIRNVCIRRQAHELVRKELPFGHSRPAQQGTWALAVSAEPRRDLLRGVQDAFVHSTLTDVLAASPGSAEERQGAEYCYHRPEIELELQKLEAQRGWLSSKPTEEDALQAVLAQFIPELADRVRAACDGGGDLDRLVARVVEDDWVRRVVEALPPALPREWPDPGVGSWSTAASDERLTHVAATTDDHRLKKVIVAYQARHDYNPGDRQRAEDVLLERRRREEEESGKTRRQAEAAASRAHDAELLRILQELCRQVQSRDFAEICRERARMRKPSPVHPAIAHNHREQARNRPDHSQGWSR